MQSNSPQIRFTFGGNFTPVVRWLLWVNGLVYLFILLLKARLLVDTPDSSLIDAQTMLIRLVGLSPRSVTNDWMFWQPITYMFVHQEFLHFILNMLGLWWFGAEVEQFMGSKSFWRYYLFTGVGGALSAILAGWNSAAITIGASGAIFGLLVAYGFLFPNRVIYLYMLVPIRAKYCVAGYGLITVYALLTKTSDGVSHVAHFGGMAFGLGWFIFYSGRSRFVEMFRNFRKRRMRRKLRLIQKKKSGDDESAAANYSNKTLH